MPCSSARGQQRASKWGACPTCCTKLCRQERRLPEAGTRGVGWLCVEALQGLSAVPHGLLVMLRRCRHSRSGCGLASAAQPTTKPRNPAAQRCPQFFPPAPLQSERASLQQQANLTPMGPSTQQHPAQLDGAVAGLQRVRQGLLPAPLAVADVRGRCGRRVRAHVSLRQATALALTVLSPLLRTLPADLMARLSRLHELASQCHCCCVTAGRGGSGPGGGQCSGRPSSRRHQHTC